MSGYNYMDGAMPRQPPNQNQPHQQANGVASVLNGIDVIPGLAKPGQLMDANHLWKIVEELSAVNEQNRAAQARIDEKTLELHLQMARGGPFGPQEVNGESPRNHATETATLRAENAHLSRENARLTNELASTQSLLNSYQTAFDTTLQKLRTYAYEHANALIAVHKHYHTLLDVERTQNLEMRLEQQNWQTGLSSVAGLVRSAFKEVSESDGKWVRERASLKRENRTLRSLVGWELEEESSDEEEAERQRGGGDAAGGEMFQTR